MGRGAGLGGAQVSAAGRRLPLERKLAFDVLTFNPATPDVPPEVSNAFATWPTVYARQLATLSGKAVPDLVLLDSRFAAALAKADVLADLGPLLRTERWFRAEDYAGDVLAAGRVRGRQLALPLAVFADTLLYDSRAFEAGSVAPPRPDWLWSDLLGSAQALTGPGRWGLYLRATGSARPFEASPSLWTIAWQRGASLIDRDGLGMTLTEPGMLDALEFLADLVGRHAVARPPDPETSIAEVMAQREVAMAATFNGQAVSWRTPQLAGFAARRGRWEPGAARTTGCSASRR